MSSTRRVYLKQFTLVSATSLTDLQSIKFDIGSSEYDATDLLRDLTGETRSAQIATGDLIDTAADSGMIDSVQINNAGTINATIIVNDLGSERDVHIYEEGGDRRLGYEYFPDRYDLGDRFADLEKEDRLTEVLNEFNELYLPELFDKPASELLPDDTATMAGAQTETEVDEQNSGSETPTATLEPTSTPAPATDTSTPPAASSGGNENNTTSFAILASYVLGFAIFSVVFAFVAYILYREYVTDSPSARP
jgi:hypothetical protein